MKNKHFFLLMLCIALIFATIIKAFSQDTTFTFKVTVPIKTVTVRDTVVHIETDTIVRIITNTRIDTVYKERLVYICPPDPLKKDTVKFSSFAGTFKQFINSVTGTGKVAVIDKDVVVTEPIGIRGDYELVGYNRPTITCNQRWLFWTYSGNHLFKDFNVVMTATNGNAFWTDQLANIIWTNTLDGITVRGGEVAYNSSRGGVESSWANTIITNCDFQVSTIAISVFSQDGPYKSLHISSTKLKTNISHNVYAHPNVSIDFDNVHHLGAGKLALHHFSRDGVPGVAEYINIKNIKTYDNYSPYQFAPNQMAFIDSSDIAIYNDGNQEATITNSNIRNAGGSLGVLVGNSSLTNCTGSIMAGNVLIKDSNLDELRLYSSGRAEVINSNIKYIGGGGLNNQFDLVLNNTKVEGMALTNIAGQSKIRLLNGSQWKALFNWKPPVGLITVATLEESL